MINETTWTKLLNEAVNRPGELLAAYRAFYGYSFGNQWAAYLQYIGRGLAIGPIATYKKWQDLGRQVKRGERGLELCVPRTAKIKKIDKEGKEDEVTFTRFAWLPRFFVLAQTDGALEPEIKTPNWDRDTAMKKLDITETPFTLLNGNCQGYASGKSISINPLAPLKHKTTFHEIAHILLGHTLENPMTDSEVTPRNIRELEAEAVAMICCATLELPGTDDARGYIQHWYKEHAVPEKSAQKIFKAANQILQTGDVNKKERGDL